MTSLKRSAKARNESGLDNIKMYYTYILQSINEPEHFYVGVTNDLQRRFQEHNSGQSIHSNKYKPWKIRGYIAFDNEEKAQQFEHFLKTGNGRIFQKKYF